VFSKDNEWVQKNHKEIELLAYFRWQEAGKPDSQDKHFWEMAENELWDKQHPDEVIEITYPRKQIKKHNIVWDYDGSVIIGGSY
jgi:hypothetical protein